MTMSGQGGIRGIENIVVFSSDINTRAEGSQADRFEYYTPRLMPRLT